MLLELTSAVFKHHWMRSNTSHQFSSWSTTPRKQSSQLHCLMNNQHSCICQTNIFSITVWKHMHNQWIGSFPFVNAFNAQLLRWWKLQMSLKAWIIVPSFSARLLEWSCFLRLGSTQWMTLAEQQHFLQMFWILWSSVVHVMNKKLTHWCNLLHWLHKHEWQSCQRKNSVEFLKTVHSAPT